jgi:ATP-dependent Lhr-like helicase
VKWPEAGERNVTRSVGASVILVNGALAAYVGRGEKQIVTFLPDDEPSRSIVAREIARALASRVDEGTRRALLVTEVDGKPVARTPLAPFLAEAGFTPSAAGYQKRAPSPRDSGERVAEGRVRGGPSSAASRHLLPAKRGEGEDDA